MLEISQAEIRRLRQAIQRKDIALETAAANYSLVNQLLATVLHTKHPAGVTIGEGHRVACERHNLFRVKLTPQDDDGTIELTLDPLTEEEVAKLDELRAGQTPETDE